MSNSDNASLTVPVEAGSLKKGDYVVANDKFPCKVVEHSKMKTGKHGAAKAVMTAIDIFTGKKYEFGSPASAILQSPIVKRVEYNLIDVDEEDYASLLDDNNETKIDLKIPEDDIGKNIKIMVNEGKNIIVSVLSAMNIEKIVQAKEDK